MGNDYSFECLIGIGELTKKIYEDDEDNVQFKLLLRNNGYKAWPKGKVKLVFDEPLFGEDNSKILYY